LLQAVYGVWCVIDIIGIILDETYKQSMFDESAARSKNILFFAKNSVFCLAFKVTRRVTSLISKPISPKSAPILESSALVAPAPKRYTIFSDSGWGISWTLRYMSCALV